MAKNPWIAAALSFFIAGLGQIYIGKIWKGIGFLALEIATSYWYYTTNSDIAGASNLAVSTVAMADAYYWARKKDSQKPSEPDATEEEPVVRVY
jgi:TM2 domain-containing membrane protein YozV